MPTSTQWRDVGVQGKYTLMNSHIFFDRQGINELANRIFDPSVQEVILGDYTKWVLSLLYFPFDLRKGSTSNSSFIIGGLTIPIQCYLPGSNYDFGFTLGEYYYAPKYNDYRDFEPYTTLQIYLPFYGYVDVTVADVIGKYIQFRLEIDFMTGQAMYTIGVNNESVASPNAPFYFGTNDANTVILSKYVFSLGVTIPVSASGMAEAVRNIAMASIRGVALATGHYFVASAGLTGGSSTSTQKTVYTGRNPRTGRQITRSTVTETRQTEYDANKYERGRAINSCFESSTDALNAMNMRPTTEKADNVFVDSQGSKSIQIVRRFAKFVPIDQHYNSLYGLPLGETRQLSTLRGYTEVTAIHFEGDEFSSATSNEIAMIENEFSDGVILPDSVYYSLTVSIIGGKSVGDIPTRVEANSDFSITLDADIGYELSKENVIVSGATFYRVIEDSSRENARYQLFFNDVVGNVFIRVICTKTLYNISATIAGGSLVGSLPSSVEYGSNFSITLDANAGYELASGGVTVTGATFDRISEDTSQETTRYQVFFTNVTGNVNITVALQSTVSDVIGTWVWNSIVTFSVPNNDSTYKFDFTVTGISCSAITLTQIDYPTGSIYSIEYTSDYGITSVYENEWLTEENRTIDIKTAPPDEFLTILQANAVKQ